MRSMTVTQYYTFDGQIFVTEEACREHEEAQVESCIDAFLVTSARSKKWDHAMRPVLRAFAQALLGLES